MISNFCSGMTIYCLNHDVPIPMKVISNTEKIKTPFYACENYIPEDKNVPPCPNRLNLDDYLGIIEKFMDIISEAPVGSSFTNY